MGGGGGEGVGFGGPEAVVEVEHTKLGEGGFCHGCVSVAGRCVVWCGVVWGGVFCCVFLCCFFFWFGGKLWRWVGFNFLGFEEEREKSKVLVTWFNLTIEIENTSLFVPKCPDCVVSEAYKNYVLLDVFDLSG